MEKFDNGLFIGRFQPFHKGHLYALILSASLCKNLIIGVGSSGDSGTERNPLPASDRIRIIKAALKGTLAEKKRIRFITIPDFMDDDKWFNYIDGKVPGIDAVFSRNRLVKKIFSAHHVKVVSPPWHDRKRLSASRIRKIIKNGGKGWQDRVPNGAVKEIALCKSKFS